MTGIYKITVDNKNYIGQANDILERWRHHISLGFGDNDTHDSQKEMYIDMAKVGLEKVSFTILELCKESELDEREEYYNRLYQAYETGYNQSRSFGTNSLTIEEGNTIIDEILKSPEKTLLQIANEYNTTLYVVKAISRGDTHKRSDLTYPLRGNKWSFYCKICGTKISSGHKFCKSCAANNRNGNKRPPREELKSVVRDFTFTDLGKKYGVDRSTISKWLKAYNLPHTKQEISNINKEEWDLL